MRRYAYLCVLAEGKMRRMKKKNVYKGIYIYTVLNVYTAYDHYICVYVRMDPL